MNRFFSIFALLIFLPLAAAAQVSTSEAPSNGSMALSPARFELEMKPGTETTVVVNLDYRAPGNAKEPVRIVATLNDWTLTKDGRVEFFRANSQPNSASPWLIYSPGEAAVMPGTIHQIRVTISVPADAAPGDHLAALIVEQRPETLKFEPNLRQMIVRYRMASVFYIKVPNLTRRGSFENLYAESTRDGIVVTPKLRNEGNSVIRPVASVRVLNAEGKTVAELGDTESIPILAGAELSQSVLINQALSPGNYTVKYHVDFGDGSRATEGITDLVVKPPPQIASSVSPAQKP
jgi:methionine-rich copper-binding protein CopC